MNQKTKNDWGFGLALLGICFALSSIFPIGIQLGWMLVGFGVISLLKDIYDERMQRAPKKTKKKEVKFGSMNHLVKGNFQDE
jgi:hypothetical protein